MDINTLRGLATVFALFAFVGVCLWAYSARRKSDFDAAANLPFADDDELGEDSSDSSKQKK